MNIVKNFKLYISIIALLFVTISVSLANNEGYYALSEALQSNVVCDENKPCIYIDADKTKAGWYQSGLSISGFKFFCNAGVSVKTTMTDYNAVSWYLKYDTDVLTNRVFNISDYLLYPVFPDVNSSLPGMGGANKNTGNPIVTTFSFVPNTSFDKAWVDVCNLDGICTPYAPTLSSTGGLGYVRAGSPDNVLQSVKGAIYDLYAWPCTPDTKAPVITGTLDNKVYTGVQTLTGLIYDYDATNTWGYWFDGHNYSETGVNYVQYNNNQTYKMDNQEGINSGVTTVNISCPECTWSDQRLSINRQTANRGASNRNLKTWDNHDRGYVVEFTTPALELERPTTVTLSGCDLPNETGAIHCTTKSFTFNKKTNPSVTGMYNTNGIEWRTNNVFPSRVNEYMITVSDNPAGIKPGSITITFNEATDLSGNSTPTYILSGSELAITESGEVTDYGVRTIYEVRFHPPYDLLEGTQTRMDVYVEDYVGNHTTEPFNLNTRAACSSFGGCRDYLNINHFGDIMGNDFTRLFSGLDIVVSGGNTDSIYPFLEGEILYCGEAWEGADLVPQGVMNLYQYGNANVQTGLRLSTPNKTVREAANSADIDHGFGRDGNNRNMIKDISVY